MILPASAVFVFSWLAAYAAGRLILRRRSGRHILRRPEAEARLASLLDLWARPADDAAQPEEMPAAPPFYSTEASLLQPLIGEHGLIARLRGELMRAGIPMRATDFAALFVISGALFGMGGVALSGRMLVGTSAGIVGAMAPLAALKLKQLQRHRLFEAQLPEMLALIASALRSGCSFPQALMKAADDLPAPASAEARRLLDELGIGVTLEGALERLRSRLNSHDVELLVVAVSIHHQVGGNLASVLDGLAETIRQRFRCRDEIAALTAEGRLSGVILFLLPVVLLGLLSAASAGYMSLLYERPIGHTMLFA